MTWPLHASRLTSRLAVSDLWHRAHLKPLESSGLKGMQSQCPGWTPMTGFRKLRRTPHSSLELVIVHRQARASLRHGLGRIPRGRHLTSFQKSQAPKSVRRCYGSDPSSSAMMLQVVTCSHLVQGLVLVVSSCHQYLVEMNDIGWTDAHGLEGVPLSCPRP